MLNLVIFGAPGSGKGTQSEKLIERYGLDHISTGEVLRDHIARNTPLGQLADTYISQGHLIPDDLMVKVLASQLDALRERGTRGVIFDGFPRTIPQARALNDVLQSRGTDLHAVVGLEVDDDELMDRLVKRGKESGRADDNPATISERLKVYHGQTAPLRDYYKDRGNYHAIDGAGDVNDIFGRIASSLDKL